MGMGLTLLVGVVLAGASNPDGGPVRHRSRHHGGAVQEARYEIDGKPVTAAQFKARLAELHGEEGWTCAETSDGGFVTYIARDASGKAFKVVTSSSATPSSISPALLE